MLGAPDAGAAGGRGSVLHHGVLRGRYRPGHAATSLPDRSLPRCGAPLRPSPVRGRGLGHAHLRLRQRIGADRAGVAGRAPDGPRSLRRSRRSTGRPAGLGARGPAATTRTALPGQESGVGRIRCRLTPSRPPAWVIPPKRRLSRRIPSTTALGGRWSCGVRGRSMEVSGGSPLFTMRYTSHRDPSGRRAVRHDHAVVLDLRPPFVVSPRRRGVARGCARHARYAAAPVGDRRRVVTPDAAWHGPWGASGVPTAVGRLDRARPARVCSEPTGSTGPR